MSEIYNSPYDYPIEGEEVAELVLQIDRLADYIFGPAEMTRAISQSKEITLQDYLHYRIVRRMYRANETPLVNIDLTIFQPDEEYTNIDFDEESSLSIPGRITAMSVSLEDDDVMLYRNPGRLTISDGGDVDVTAFHNDGEDIEEPNDIPTTPTFSDVMHILGLIVLEQHG